MGKGYHFLGHLEIPLELGWHRPRGEGIQSPEPKTTAVHTLDKCHSAISMAWP